MTFWSLENIKGTLGGGWLARPEPARSLAIEGVATDSRSVRPGQVFFALRGEKTDGHHYLSQAAAAGSPLLVIDQPAFPADLPKHVAVLRVPGTGQALLKLAQAYRRTLDTTRVIAVAGSNGKTTTVRLIQSILSRRLRGSASIKSFNNAVGVPLTILAAKRTDQYLICEVGTNAPGEIATLAAVVEPDIGVVTSIGREHLEGLGSLKGVVAEEASLFASLRPGGLAVISADAPLLTDAVRPGVWPNVGSVVRFGLGPDADLRVTNAQHDEHGVNFSINSRGTHRLPMPGVHNACNAAAAIAVARRLGLDQSAIEEGLAGVTPPDMRLQRTTLSGITLLNDAYNANPDSMLAALATFRDLAGAKGVARRVLILGDMLELGEAGVEAHREVGRAVAALAGTPAAPHLVFAVGALSIELARAAEDPMPPGGVIHLPDAGEQHAARVASLLRPGDFVLLKGSRGVGLERIIAALEALALPAEPKIHARRPDPHR